jgi:hypothetical protein
MQFSKAIKNKMLPHFIVLFQWTLLVLCIVFNLNFSVFMTAAVAQGGLKAIMFLHLLVPFLSIILFPIFYRIDKKGIEEKCIISLLLIIPMFSFANIYLHLVDDLVSLMKVTELAAWSLFNIVFSISLYKILAALLLSVQRRYVKLTSGILRHDKMFRA